MKNAKYVLLPLLIILIVSLSVLDVLAAGTGLVMEELPQEKQEHSMKVTDLSLLLTEPQRTSIDCFDVREDHTLAVGYSVVFPDLCHAVICVYSPDGVFQYGYEFFTSGAYKVEWAEDNLLIYFVRSNHAYEVTPKGEIVSVTTIASTEENREYWRKSVESRKRTIGDTVYRLKNDMGPVLNFLASSYSQVVRIDSDGETVYLIDNSSQQLVKYIISITLILLFITISQTILIKEILKERKRYLSKQQKNECSNS